MKTSTPTPEEEGGYSEDVFGDSRLASKSEKMMYFCSVDLYEDEIGDAGSLTIGIKLAS